MEYQCLIRECQIYKTYTILLGIAAGCSVLFFDFDNIISLILSGGLLFAVCLFAALTVNQYNAMYKAYPFIYDMRSSRIWYAIYGLWGAFVTYVTVLPEISRLNKSILIAVIYTFIPQHPIRGIKKHIRKQTTRR